MPELDSLRGVAVLMVLFLHGMAPPLNANLSSFGRSILKLSSYGGAGVNVFFVLSGFLITGILLDSRSRPEYYRRFYFRRVLRIVPAFAITLLLLLLCGRIDWKFFLVSALCLANYAPLLGLVLQYPVLWSLAVEEHFYAVWPAVIRKSSSAWQIALVIVLCLLSVSLRALTFHRDPKSPANLYTWCNLDGLALGASLAIWLRSRNFRRSQLSRVAAPLLLGGVLAFVFLMARPGMADAALEAFVRDLGSVGLLACTLLLGTDRWRFLVVRPFLKFVGYISYGLYLIHTAVFRAVELAFAGCFHWLVSLQMPTAAMLLRFVLGSALAIGIAYASRVLIEEKFLRMGTGAMSRSHETVSSTV
jgi:peptidoglycan/LPS O-acetylase OafA/YrhL